MIKTVIFVLLFLKLSEFQKVGFINNIFLINHNYYIEITIFWNKNVLFIFLNTLKFDSIFLFLGSKKNDQKQSQSEFHENIQLNFISYGSKCK